MRHIGMLSSGVSSAYTCKLMIDEVGKTNSTLLFTDTLMEHVDNYRFLDEITDYLGVELVRLDTGESPFDVFDREGILGSDRIPLCSRILKLEQTKKLAQAGDTLWWGIDWEEKHRAVAIERNWLESGISSRFPLIEQLTMYQTRFDWLVEIGIKPPVMYEMKYSHSNCGGMCVRGGLNHWAHLYATLPENYAYAEAREAKWQKLHGKENTILRKSIGGQNQNLSLKQYRENYLEGQLFTDTEYHDSGACACMGAFEGSDDGYLA